ncbi:MAG: sigma-70 family RNA polymerase sigma factor [Candidatus Hydrogenedentes bacterium]|nr:sigma-70 family RNA polymerase sigma factor [Candidatus Hydrogenedentota bacterium]
MIAEMGLLGRRMYAQNSSFGSAALMPVRGWAEDNVCATSEIPEVSGLHLMANRDVTTENVSDHALIHACLKHDKNAFAQLIQRYEASVTAILWRFTRDRVVLEELVQDTFVEAYFSLRRFRADAPFFPWLRTIATRVGYRSWRRARRDRLRNARFMQWGSAGETGITKTEPTDSAEYMYRVLEMLDPKDRLVLTLQYFEGCSTNEIAERMGWSTSLVKVRAFRARKRLKTLLLEMEDSSHGRS